MLDFQKCLFEMEFCLASFFGNQICFSLTINFIIQIDVAKQRQIFLEREKEKHEAVRKQASSLLASPLKIFHQTSFSMHTCLGYI